MKNKKEKMFSIKRIDLDGKKQQFIINGGKKIIPFRDEKGEDGMILRKIFETLTTRESTVLLSRFGLNDGRPRTLKEVSQVYNLSIERIRQIEAKGLRKLRSFIGRVKNDS